MYKEGKAKERYVLLSCALKFVYVVGTYYYMHYMYVFVVCVHCVFICEENDSDASLCSLKG